MSELLHQKIAVINMTGANGTIASEHVARSADGYARSSEADSNLVVSLFLYHITYDPLRDFAPISVTVRVWLALMVPPSGPNALQELIAKATANPSKLNYASVGFGSAHDLGTEDFKLRTDTNIGHMPFKGATAATAALPGGQINMEFTSIGQAKLPLQAGKVKVLAAAALHRPSNAAAASDHGGGRSSQVRAEQRVRATGAGKDSCGGSSTSCPRRRTRHSPIPALSSKCKPRASRSLARRPAKWLRSRALRHREMETPDRRDGCEGSLS